MDLSVNMDTYLYNKIIDSYKEELNITDSDVFNYIDKFDINILDSSSIKKILDEKEKELKTLERPKLIINEEDYVTTESGFKRSIVPLRGKVDQYEGMSTEEAEKKISEINLLLEEEYVLETFHRITSLRTKVKKNSDKPTSKKKRDTKSKRNVFINLYLVNATKYKMDRNDLIAKHNNISRSTASRYLNNLGLKDNVILYGKMRLRQSLRLSLQGLDPD